MEAPPLNVRNEEIWYKRFSGMFLYGILFNRAMSGIRRLSLRPYAYIGKKKGGTNGIYTFTRPYGIQPVGRLL